MKMARGRGSSCRCFIVAVLLLLLLLLSFVVEEQVEALTMGNPFLRKIEFMMKIKKMVRNFWEVVSINYCRGPTMILIFCFVRSSQFLIFIHNYQFNFRRRFRSKTEEDKIQKRNGSKWWNRWRRNWMVYGPNDSHKHWIEG